MRIIHAYKVYQPEIEGGVPEVISGLAQGAPGDLETSVVVCRLRGFGQSYVHQQVRVVASTSLGSVASLPLAPLYLPTLLQAARSAQVVVHHAPFPLTDLAVPALQPETSLIVHWHAEIIGRTAAKWMLAPFIRNSLDRAHRIIVSHSAIIDHSEFLRPFAKKCIALPYGVDTAYWGDLTAREKFEVELLADKYPNLIVSVGRLVGYKGYSLTLRALQNIDAKLVIIGEGPLRFQLQELAQELGLGEKVKFAGRLPRNEIKMHLHAAKCLVLASVSAAESFGIVQAEAMAAGCPIINTDLPSSVPFVARHGVEALTVNPNDWQSLEQAMQTMLANSELRRRLSENARNRAKSAFSLHQFRNKNYEVYREAGEVSGRHQRN